MIYILKKVITSYYHILYYISENGKLIKAIRLDNYNTFTYLEMWNYSRGDITKFGYCKYINDEDCIYYVSENTIYEFKETY